MDYKELLESATEYVKDNIDEINDEDGFYELISNAAISAIDDVIDSYKLIDIILTMDNYWRKEESEYGGGTLVMIAGEMIERALIQDLNLEFVRKSKYDIPVWEEGVEDERD
jgi:hypothetical protein